MKVLYALYDENDNYISSGFSLKEVGVKITRSWFWQHTVKKYRLYRLPLEVQNDCFKEEDEIFNNEFREEVYTNKELAQMAGLSLSGYNKRKANANINV